MVIKTRKPATLHDVAKIANVSYQTVSRVINNNPNVADDTRQRVLLAIEKLHYRPNRAARSLITGRSNTLQVIMFAPYYTWTLVDYIIAAMDAGYLLTISSLTNQFDRENILKVINELSGRLVDGFILVNPECCLSYDELNRLTHGAPCIQTEGNPDNQLPAVVFDQKYGIEQVVNHLLDLGHTRIAEISGSLNTYDGRIRHETLKAILNDQKLELISHLESDFTVRGGYLRACELLDRNKDFTALVCGNDEIALGVLSAMNERGIHVPQDISIVGFDDEVRSAYFNPPLTTVKKDHSLLGRQAIQYLISMIEDAETPHHQLKLLPPIVIRSSTAPIK